VVTSVPAPLRRKSTYSGTNGDCFEISDPWNETTAVRNSKHTTAGSLVFASSNMGAFVAACRAGEFDDLAL
jgi:Domain of unknown function (DUF397)